MRLLDKLRLRLRSLFRRALVERELEAELRFHLDQLVEENIAAGLPPSEARAAALRTIGGMAQFQESCRDTRRLNLLEDLARDLQHALRVLRRSSGFTAVAVLTLALGIGATTAIFSVVYGVLLKPLPFSEPDRLVGVWHQPVRLGGAAGAIQNHGPATYFVYRDNNQVFEDLGAWDTSQVSVIGLGEPERVQALSVGEGTLPLLRVRPLLGRSFDAADVQPGGPPRVMLSHGYWQRRFGGAADVLGKRVVLDGVANEIIGVLPASFVFLRTSPALLQPLRLDRANIPNLSFGFQVLARLKPGVTLAQANADLARMIPLLPPAYGRYQLGPNVRPLVEDVTGNLDRILWILMATVGFVLLIACANVANLFLVRAEGRHRELAVRAVLGASRGRIARQLVAESLVLTLAGGLVGLMLAQLALGLVRRLAPVVLPRIEDIGIDGVVLLFTLALALLAAVAFGLVPVLRLGASNAPTLKEGGRPASEGRRRQRARNALVVAQVAMALVLLIGSGLMIRTFVALWQVHPGFVRPEAVQTFRIRVPRALAAEQEQMVRTHDRIAQRLRQVAGVQSVGLASSITLDGEDNMNPIFVEHVHAPYQKLPPHRRFKSVGPGYFETVGSHLVAGRAFSWTDIYQARPVIMVSEQLAREHWREPSAALGKRIGYPDGWSQIIGVVGDQHDDGLGQPPTAIVFWPLLNNRYSSRTLTYTIRSSRVGAPGFLGELRQAVWSVNPDLPLADVRTLEQIRDDSMAQTSFVMVILAIAASVALLLGLVGIYGVIAYVATLRKREIGIRLALGAQPGHVRRLLLRQGLALTGTGIALGTAVSLALTPVLSALLFGVGTTDPLTYLAVSVGLGGVALLATWLPARRASRNSPMVALRAEG